MIIESHTFSSKSDLQKAVSKLNMTKAVIYKDVDKRASQEILLKAISSKRVTIVVIES